MLPFPHIWPVHDASSITADIIRELLDVFMMPVLFFIAGYFALPSLKKNGMREFLNDKIKRLLIPWILAVLVFFPIILYGQTDQSIRPFWNYWLWYLGSFETGLSFLSQTQPNQAVYWFISLLFAFFAAFALVYAIINRLRNTSTHPSVPESISNKSVTIKLLLFGTLTFIVYFISLLFFPDTSWFTLGIFLQFQPTKLILFIGYFMLGIYARSQRWFASGKPLGSSSYLWGMICAILIIAYLVVGQPVFTNPAGTPYLPVELLLAFAFVRSFLLLSLLVVFVSAGVQYWNRSTSFDRQLSDTSYNIYLTHFWIIVTIQEALVAWIGGPVMAKFVIVLLAALVLSFAISKWLIGRYPRAFAMVFILLLMFCLVARP